MPIPLTANVKFAAPWQTPASPLAAGLRRLPRLATPASLALLLALAACQDAAPPAAGTATPGRGDARQIAESIPAAGSNLSVPPAASALASAPAAAVPAASEARTGPGATAMTPAQESAAMPMPGQVNDHSTARPTKP